MKFFERLKAVKHLNRVEKDLANANPESDKQRLESDLKKAREDLIYVKFFPKDAKYVSLYGRRSGADKIDEKGRAQQDKYRAEAVSEKNGLRFFHQQTCFVCLISDFLGIVFPRFLFVSS